MRKKLLKKCSGCGRKLSKKTIKWARALGADHAFCKKCTGFGRFPEVCRMVIVRRNVEALKRLRKR